MEAEAEAEAAEAALKSTASKTLLVSPCYYLLSPCQYLVSPY